MEILNDYTNATLVKLERVTYKKKSLIGIFSWYVKVNAEKIQDDIVVVTNKNFVDVYVNGCKYRPDF